LEVNQTKQRTVRRPCDARSIERGVRQCLADKVSGSLVGLWLLIPEHLRLGTWDLLCGWTGQVTGTLEPRLAMQLVHEAALCITGLREQRSLTQQDFNLANGLPFVASDRAIHDLLNAHSVAEAQALQVAFGRIRRSRGHFCGKLLAIDPHRLTSYTKRPSRRRQAGPNAPARKTAQTFFCLDADTDPPVCFITGSPARTVARATPELLAMAQEILGRQGDGALVVADTEHLCAELLDHVSTQTPFDLLVPLPQQKHTDRRARAIPPDAFRRHWAGWATAKMPYAPVHSRRGPYTLMIQRFGERPEDWTFNSFLCTADREEVEALSRDYPDRWHVEEFFNIHQDLGWKRAGTQNLHIRYGQMTLALLAQGALAQLRQRLPEPMRGWSAKHFASEVLRGLDGDVRVCGDRIVVTFYGARQLAPSRHALEHLPERLAAEGVDPRMPWLYNYRLDFRLK
jgi:hypothetical protein